MVKPNSKQALDQLQHETETVLATLGYEVVALEQSTAGGHKLTLYIDFLNNSGQSRRIGLDDCVTVNKAVDELFENTPLLTGAYTLEVSSPGVERPLRKAEDYSRFSGRKVKLHTFRPLDKDELGNENYWEKHKKQKNFVGRLEGLAADPERARPAGKLDANGADARDHYKVKLTIDGEHIAVPLALISKAHLEIDFTMHEGVIQNEHV